MQKMTEKVKQLILNSSIHQQAIAKMVGYKHASSLSKAIGSGKNFTPDKVNLLSKVLGVKVEFLRDSTYVYTSPEEIPEWAILKPIPAPPTPSTPTDLSELARILERQAADIARSENERAKIEVEALKESNRQMAQILNEVTGNLLTLSEIVRELKEERDGGHDPD